MSQFMVHFNGASVFVKEYKFFLEQKKESPEWNTKAWAGPIQADGIEHARLLGKAAAEKGTLTREGGYV